MANDTSSFAASVEAELKDAKVVFDERNGAKIATAPATPNVTVSEPEPETKPGPKTKPSPVQAADAASPVNATINPDPNRKLNPPRPPATTTATATKPALSANWVEESNAADANQSQIPDTMRDPKYLAIGGVVFLVLVGFVFRNPSAILFLVIAILLGAFFFRGAISASKSTSRTTTRMPYDKKRDRTKDKNKPR